MGDATNMAIRPNGDIYIQNTNATLQKMTIKSDGEIGIGTSTPSSTLNVKGDTILDGGLNINCQYPSLPYSSYYYNNSEIPEFANTFRNYKANGAIGTLTNIVKDDLLTAFQGHGYDTTSGFHSKSSTIRMFASQNYTPTANGGYLTLKTNQIVQ